jgi:hypothetical protein
LTVNPNWQKFFLGKEKKQKHFRSGFDPAFFGGAKQ